MFLFSLPGVIIGWKSSNITSLFVQEHLNRLSTEYELITQPLCCQTQSWSGPMRALVTWDVQTQSLSYECSHWSRPQLGLRQYFMTAMFVSYNSRYITVQGGCVISSYSHQISLIRLCSYCPKLKCSIPWPPKPQNIDLLQSPFSNLSIECKTSSQSSGMR